MLYKNKKAQSAIEYAMLIAAVALAFSTMFYYAKRAVDGKLKMIERQANLSLEE